MKTLIIEKKYDNKKLNSILLDVYPGLKLNSIYKALRKKDIRINGIRVSENIILKANDEVKIYISDELFDEHYNLTRSSDTTKIVFTKENIIFEDSNIIAVNKPSGIEVTGENSLTSILSGIIGYPVFPCHRLDRNTNGITLFAKNEESLNILFNKFKSHEIEKHYIATVYGIPKKNSDILIGYLFKDAKKFIVYISDVPKKGYQKIITEYTLLSKNQNENTSVLDITLHTGKTHQIRAHLAHIGLPIIGDGKYGNNAINKRFKCSTQQLCSKSLQFKFTSDSDILNYLNNKKISL